MRLKKYNLMNSNTAKKIRRATPKETAESLNCGQHEGHIYVEIKGDSVLCYVQEA